MKYRIIKDEQETHEDGKFKAQYFVGVLNFGFWLTHDIYVDYTSPRRFPTYRMAAAFVRDRGGELTTRWDDEPTDADRRAEVSYVVRHSVFIPRTTQYDRERRAFEADVIARHRANFA